MPKPYSKTETGKLHQGDCREILKSCPDDYFTTVVTDPPYELKFMGKKWDGSGVSFQVDTWKEILRVAKPGAMLLAFGGTRTHHRLMCAIEDAGWEIRDCMMWIYGSGFPKSLDISKAIDKAAGAERKVVGTVDPRGTFDGKNRNSAAINTNWRNAEDRTDVIDMSKKSITAPSTESAKLWDGYGTALKPAYEPIIVAMKPCDGTFANNALVHGVAGLNIDAGRIAKKDGDRTEYGVNGIERSKNNNVYGEQSGKIQFDGTQGRWPANIILDEEAGAIMDEQSGERPGCKSPSSAKPESKFRPGQGNYMPQGTIHPDTGGASRFFYCAKTSKSERMGSKHPTIKPLKLIEYLIKLTCPPENAKILDPFIGSGTTGIICEKLGIKYVGIDLECEPATERISNWRILN